MVLYFSFACNRSQVKKCRLVILFNLSLHGKTTIIVYLNLIQRCIQPQIHRISGVQVYKALAERNLLVPQRRAGKYVCNEDSKKEVHGDSITKTNRGPSPQFAL